MRRIADRADVRMRDRAQIGVDEDAAARIGRDAGGAGERRRGEPARPHADVAGDRSSRRGDDRIGANLGHGLVVDQLNPQAGERGADRFFHARALERAATRAAHHADLGGRPGGLDLARRLDRGLGAADHDDAQPPRAVGIEPRPQRRRRARALAGFEPVGMRRHAGDGLHLDGRAERIDRLLEGELLLARLRRQADAPLRGIERDDAAGDECDRGSLDQSCDRGTAWRNCVDDRLLQPHPLQELVGGAHQRDAQSKLAPTEPQRSISPA